MKTTFAVMAFGLLSGLSLIAGPVLTFDQSTGINANNQNQPVGWKFNVLTAITVDELGWYDQNQDGLGDSHEVGIWNSAGTLLTSVLVPAGTVAGLDGVYRMVSVSPILLPVGTGYIVGGENFTDSTDRLAANVTQTVDPRLTYVDATYSPSSGFGDPTYVSVSTAGFYGPMFGAEPSGVPEPATVFLGGSGLLIAAALRRLLRQR